MKSIVLYIIIILCFKQSVSSQNTFVKEFDLNNHSWDNAIGHSIKGEDLFLISQSCERNCISIAKINNNDSITYYQEIDIVISDNPYIIDQDTIIIFGDNKSNDIYSKLIYKQTLESQVIYEKAWSDPKNQAIGIDHEGSIFFKEQYVSIGSFYDRIKYEQGKYKIKGYISFINRDGTIDSFLVFDKYHSVRFRDVDIDKDGYLTIRADIIDTTLPDGYQDCIWIIKLDENRNVIWEWKSNGQLSTPDPGHIKCTQEGNILLQNYQKRRGPGFAQTVELLNENKEIEWKQFKPWSFNNRYVYQINETDKDLFVIGAFTDLNVFPTLYTSKIYKDKLLWDRKYINFHENDKDFQLTNQPYCGAREIRIINENNYLLLGSKQLFYKDPIDSQTKVEWNVILIQTDSFGCVDLDKCNDYYAWGDVPDSLFQYDQIDMKQKEWYFSITNNNGVTETKHLTFGQDSILFDRLWGDRQYKEVLISDANKENTILDTLFVRWENTGKLFFIDKWIPKDGVVSPADSILYDFTLEVGDKFLLPHGFGFATVVDTDSVSLFDGYKRKRITLKHDNNTNQNKFGNLKWIEGIGAENGLFYFNDWINQSYTTIDCYLDRGMKRWGNSETCKPVIAMIDTSDYKVGDRWLFTPHSLTCKEKIVIVDVVRDTLIEDKLCNVAGITKENNYIKESEVILFYKDSIVKFYEDGEFKIVYDFRNKNVGDTVEFYFPKQAPIYDISSSGGSFFPDTNSYKYTITNKSTVIDENGNDHSKYDITLIYNEPCYDLGREIIEGVGSLSGIFGIACIQLPSGCPEYFRCFKGNQFCYTASIKDCELVTTKDINKQEFYINPNPSNDKIEIISDIDFDKIIIYSLTGQKKIIHKNEKMINISELLSGLYIIELERKGQLIGRQKFVKSQ